MKSRRQPFSAAGGAIAEKSRLGALEATSKAKLDPEIFNLNDGFLYYLSGQGHTICHRPKTLLSLHWTNRQHHYTLARRGPICSNEGREGHAP